MKRLNGWQRIFILLSLGWLSYCIWFASAEWPSEATYRATIMYEAQSKYLHNWMSAPTTECLERFKSKGQAQASLTCAGEATGQEMVQMQPLIDAYVAQGEAHLDQSVTRLRERAVGLVVGIWLAGSVAFYVAVWLLLALVRWVARGFSPSP